MVDRNNAGRLAAGFISVCLETRWLGQNRCFYVPEPPCMDEITPASLGYPLSVFKWNRHGGE